MDNSRQESIKKILKNLENINYSNENSLKFDG